MKMKCPQLILLILFIFPFISFGQAMAKRTERVSVSSSGDQAGDDSWGTSSSSDGRYIAFQSGATNLVENDSNNETDVFVHDRYTGTTSRVSVISGTTTGGNGSSSRPSISETGRYIAFQSSANDLVSGDTEGETDIFVYDRNTGTTTRVSLVSGTTTGGNDNSYTPSISLDGQFVAFYSYANDLVAGDTEGYPDIFVHERNTGITTRMSVVSGTTTGGNNDSYNPSISSDGRYVAFDSNASNLVTGDTNSNRDIFVHDRNTGLTRRVSISTAGLQVIGGDSNDPKISMSGRFVAFRSGATTLVSNDTNGFSDYFVHDRDTDENDVFDEPGKISTERVSVSSSEAEGNGHSGAYGGGLSSDGRYVAFSSAAANLVDDDRNGAEDIFVRDRKKGTTVRVSVASDGTEGAGGASFVNALSADGRYVSFASTFPNLVGNDTNGKWDIFVRDYLDRANAGTNLLLLED